MNKDDMKALVEEVLTEQVRSFNIELEPSDVEPAVKAFGTKFLSSIESKSKTELSAVKDLRKELEEIVKGVRAGNKKAIAKAIRLTAISEIDSELAAFLDIYCAPGKALNPVMIEGPKGTGKTFSIFSWCVNRYGLENMEFCGVNSGFEAADFTGYLIKAPDGNLAFLDGPITRAARMALERPTVLFVDEVYRADARDRSPFINFLSEHSIGGVESYICKTPRALKTENGRVTETETIIVPCRNLAVIGATNVGSQYNIDEGDEAEKERWIPYYFGSNYERTIKVLTATGEELGMPANEAKQVAIKLAAFQQNCENWLADKSIAMAPSLRTLKKPLIASCGNRNALRQRLGEFALMWAGKTLEGKPAEEPLKKLKEAINKI
jgi:hypothetical protein